MFKRTIQLAAMLVADLAGVARRLLGLGRPARPGPSGSGRHSTLLDLVSEVAKHSSSESELIDSVVRLVNSREVVLSGSFRGQVFGAMPALHDSQPIG